MKVGKNVPETHPGLCSHESKRETECYLPIHQNQALGHQDQEIKTLLHGRKKTE